jgi:hypothetical protein
VTNMTNQPTPDFTSPIAGRIEVRDPGSWCGDRQMIPRSQMDEHVMRLHPDVKTAVSSAGVVQLPPTNQAALRERIAERLTPFFANFSDEDSAKINAGEAADAVLKALPAPVDRAAVLLEAAEALGRMDYDTDSNDYGYDTYRDAWNGGVMDGAEELRRLAADAPATEEQPAQPRIDETQDADPIETSTEAALGQAEERLRQVLAVAEVIEANGIGWAADSVRRAAKGELS